MKSDSANTFNYYNMHALQQYESKAKQNQADLEVVAGQLESVFLKLMLKSMREAQDSFKSELFSSESGDFYRDMYDNQLTLSLSNTHSIGLKEVILKQIKGHGNQQE